MTSVRKVSFGIAVMRCCSAAVLGSGKGESGLRLEAEDEMSKFKIQMTNDGV